MLIPMLLLPLLALPLAAPPAADEAAVLQALHRGCDAFRDGDVAFLSGFLDEGFTLTDSRGQVTTREQNLEEVRRREPRYEVFRNHSMKVRFYGSAAVVNGITSLKGTSGGQPFEADFQFTDTLVKRGGGWKLVASHATRLAQTQ
ncbi:MAG TPA: nuclear transport factor 2 family protein [Vicinamibacteria bacterium]